MIELFEKIVNLYISNGIANLFFLSCKDYDIQKFFNGSLSLSDNGISNVIVMLISCFLTI